MERKNRKIFIWLCVVLMSFMGQNILLSDFERTAGPYVPSPDVVVDKMLEMAAPGPDDFLIDLGSGDGIIVLTAAKRYKTRGLGVEIDPELVELSNKRAKSMGIEDLVHFEVRDLFETDISSATIVTTYLLPCIMEKLRPKLFNEPPYGARVISHDYHVQEWPADAETTMEVPEKEDIMGEPEATVYLWIVPARVAGEWEIKIEDGREMTLDIWQTYQLVDGIIKIEGLEHELSEAKLRGTELFLV